MKWIYRRVMTAVLTLFTTTTILFFLFRLMPGNIIDSLITYYVERLNMPYSEARQLLSSCFGMALDKPLYEQYISFIQGIFTGNLGRSIGLGNTPVVEIVAKAIPWTVFTVSIGLFSSFLAGIFLGLAAAYKHGSILDKVLTSFSMISTSIPNFILAYFLIMVFTAWLGLLPSIGAYDAISVSPGFNLPFILNVLTHAILPITSYFIASFGNWVLYMRGSAVSVLGADYVFAARARGLTESKISWKYVGRNAMLPLFTLLAINIGYIFGGSTLIEYVFSYPGIGYYISTSVSTRDYPLMQGLFFILTLSVTFSNLMADLVYSRLDPRVRFE